jgi:hypothetical protein
MKFDDRLLDSYLQEISLRKDINSLYVDQVTVVKSLINRPDYVLSER